MNLSFNADTPKEEVFTEVAKYLESKQLKVIQQDRERPWGGFFVIDESQAEHFIQYYFPHLKKEDLLIGNKLSPKILIVAPEKRLSWQYHHRRAEIWKLIGGSAEVITSDTDEEHNSQVLNPGNIIQLKQGERHRLIGMSAQWGVLAEIWQHTNTAHPSDEEDIVRVQDDFGR